MLRFFLGSVLAALTPFFSTPGKAARKIKAPSLPDTLSAYLDTLIPRDDSPGALDVGGLEHMLASSAGDLKLKVLIHHGTVWLDKRAREAYQASFSALDAAARELIVENASQAPKNSIPRAFFEETRRVAMRHFYAHPSTWPALNYQGPPQPTGFPDYTRPPT